MVYNTIRIIPLPSYFGKQKTSPDPKIGVYQKFKHEQCLYFLSSFYTFWILFPDSSIESSHEIFSLPRRKIVSPVKASYTTNKPLCSFAHRIVTVQFFLNSKQTSLSSRFSLLLSNSKKNTLFTFKYFKIYI